MTVTNDSTTIQKSCRSGMNQAGYSSNHVIIPNISDTGPTDSVSGVTITNQGSGYTSVPSVSFTPVNGGTGAAGTVNLGFPIASVAVNTAGSFATFPTVTTVGPGSGATFNTTMKAVNPVVVTAPGTGYVQNDTVTFAGGTHSTATVVTVLTTQLRSLALSSVGATGYSAGDTITLTGGVFTTAPILTVTSTSLYGSNIANGGSGYQIADTITLGGGTSSVKAVVSVQLVQMTGISVSSGGTGYAVNDLITLSFGTSVPNPSVVQVTSVSAGVITGISMHTQGIYSATVSTYGQASTTGSGSGALFNNAVYSVVSVSLTVGGSYTVNPTSATQFATSGTGSGIIFNNLTFQVGTFSITNPGVFTTNATTLTQSSSSGPGTGSTFNSAVYGINSVNVTTAGSYTVLPSNPVSQASSSGSGTLATFTPPWGINTIPVGSGGNDYNATSDITFLGGSPTVGADATITLSTTGRVESVTMTNQGSGYIAAPTVGFSGGGGSSAAGTAILGGGISQFNISFVTPLPDTAYDVVVSADQACFPNVTSKTVNGCTVILNPVLGQTITSGHVDIDISWIE